MIADALIDPVVLSALQEDLAGGDLTSEACVDAELTATATALAKSELVVCGGRIFARAFLLLDPAASFEQLVPEGERVSAGTDLFRVRGNARALLAAERTGLNLVQRLSGTATLARHMVDLLPPGCATRITDTRKTTPGLRRFERYAVRIGGAHNHRDQLGSAVMIKDNHIVAAGGISQAIARARAYAPHSTRVECEVASLQELDEALAAGADIIMLDNFDDEQMRQAVRRVEGRDPRPLLEASGGIREDRIRTLGEIGVDVISVGALTHSAKAADISLNLQVGV